MEISLETVESGRRGKKNLSENDIFQNDFFNNGKKKYGWF